MFCRVFLFFFAISLFGCAKLDEINIRPLSANDKANLERVEKEMLGGYAPEVEVDGRIAMAVKQMVKTLRPEYRSQRFFKKRLGFLEISDIDRETVTMLHNYITEKTLTFSFLQPVIAENFNIVERFLLKDLIREIHLENYADPRVIDQRLAKELGRMYDLDVIETGVVSASPDYYDLNLRMIETETGLIIAVGSVKIEKTELTRKWLEKMAEQGVGWPDQYDYRW